MKSYLYTMYKNPDFFGIDRYCNICGYRFSKFEKIGWSTHTPKREARCPLCGSLERHRHLYIHILSLYPFLKNKNILHFAPEPILKNLFIESGANYFDADLNSDLAKYKIDITNIDFNDNFFDYIFCIHVLEHIQDDNKAMSELFRVLKPGGIAYLCVPLCDSFKEDLSITDENERDLIYGDKDHVRFYDLVTFTNRLAKAGFNTDLISSATNFPAYLVKDALLGDGIFVLARKDQGLYAL